MAARKEDEIMAEYLLKGGKMLEKSCRTCGCPLFEVKGKILCVVCAENKAPDKEAKSAKKPAISAGQKAAFHGQDEGSACNDEVLEEQLASTIHSLCQRIQKEQDPESVLKLMNAVRAGTEALGILRRL
jgi:UPF0148 protein